MQSFPNCGKPCLDRMESASVDLTKAKEVCSLGKVLITWGEVTCSLRASSPGVPRAEGEGRREG